MTSSPNSSRLSFTVCFSWWDLRDSFDKFPPGNLFLALLFASQAYFSPNFLHEVFLFKSSSLRCLARVGVPWAKLCVFRQPKLPFPGSQSEKKKKSNRRERNCHSFRAEKLRQGEIKGLGSQILFRILSCLIISLSGIKIISFLMVTKLFSGVSTPMGHFSWEVKERCSVTASPQF